MEIYKLQQVVVLIVCTVAGCVCGVVYDIFRAWRRCSGQTPLKVAVCDVLFWTISAVIVYLAIHLSNNAELRWYEPAGVISGYAVYTLYLSKHCTHTLCKLITMLNKIGSHILKLLCIPQKFLHILILPLERYSTTAKTRLLYIKTTLLDKSKLKIPGGLMSDILKKLRK